jgi:hypothetical protein
MMLVLLVLVFIMFAHMLTTNERDLMSNMDCLYMKIVIVIDLIMYHMLKKKKRIRKKL